MPSAPQPAQLLLLGLSFVSCLLLPSHAGGALSPPPDAPTAYEVLERYGFPRGILPEGVKSYLLRKDGTFEAYLGGYGDCNFAVAGGYTLRYRRKITGRLDVDGPTRAIRELKGVRVKLFFVWLPIGDVVRGDAELRFHVGPLWTTFPVSDFGECPRCRCGFDCAAAAAASPGSLAA
ncbi:hypothetical protein Taro_008661 [Colocasia esculenta]|uniref:Uncharacterized protein n=1 Tax=Colocasia esculenta TaxID=4460 RepID=A0A843U1R2_COLES|nr:hypothetical protein [Colocasia esculenta]